MKKIFQAILGSTDLLTQVMEVFDIFSNRAPPTEEPEPEEYEITIKIKKNDLNPQPMDPTTHQSSHQGLSKKP